MKFLKLTYYKSPKKYGTGGATTKVFYQRVDLITRLTPYNESTKIHFSDGTEEEVTESVEEIIDRIKKLVGA